MKNVLPMLVIFYCSAGLSQTGGTETKRSAVMVNNDVVMPAGARFAASGWKQFWWGKHWRREWLTPVSFPVLDLDTTASGLTPKKEGGGKETKSLRVVGGNG